MLPPDQLRAELLSIALDRRVIDVCSLGHAQVVVGARSAIYAPVPNLGIIVVDEEGDGAYKQEETPRYHGRDVAVMRAKRERALVVLGSATPSLESYHNARGSRYELVTHEKRVLDRPLASVRVVDMRDEYARRGPEVVLSEPLVAGIDARLERSEQVLVLLNRRGYATSTRAGGPEKNFVGRLGRRQESARKERPCRRDGTSTFSLP